MSAGDSLKSRWERLMGDFPAEVGRRWWQKVFSQYDDPSRHYHNLQHLFQMFEHLDKFSRHISNQKSIAFAIFFHDLHYDPKAADNEEKSSDLFKEFAADAGIPADSSLHNEVTDLILLTKTHLTEEHKEEGAIGVDDKHFFLDFDMAILGSESEDYTVYAESIRQEYGFLSEAAYNGLRSKVLKSFLMIPNIFVTEQFQKLYEAKARRNIEQEINALEV